MAQFDFKCTRPILFPRKFYLDQSGTQFPCFLEYHHVNVLHIAINMYLETISICLGDKGGRLCPGLFSVKIKNTLQFLCSVLLSKTGRRGHIFGKNILRAHLYQTNFTRELTI